MKTAALAKNIPWLCFVLSLGGSRLRSDFLLQKQCENNGQIILSCSRWLLVSSLGEMRGISPSFYLPEDFTRYYFLLIVLDS